MIRVDPAWFNIIHLKETKEYPNLLLITILEKVCFGLAQRSQRFQVMVNYENIYTPDETAGT